MKPTIGIVIGHFNSVDMLRLNVRMIRDHCGTCPILIADDCSDGFGPPLVPHAPAGQLLDLVSTEVNLHLWPNPGRIGHAGGDMSAFAKGLWWASNLGVQCLAKLSQRFLIDVPGWLDTIAQSLWDANLAIAGRSCIQDGWRIRTEACVLRVEAWNRPDILSALTPRPIGHPTENAIGDLMARHFGGEFLDWPILAPGRRIAAHAVYFRAANSASDYATVARRYGLTLQPETREHKDLPNYKLG